MAKAKVSMGLEVFEKFWVQVDLHKRFVLLLLLFAIVVDVIAGYTRS